MPQMRPIWHMRIFTDPTLTDSCTPAYKIFKDHSQDPISHILTTDELTKDESHHGVYFTAIQLVCLKVNLLNVCGNFTLSSACDNNLYHECAISHISYIFNFAALKSK